MRCNKKTLKIDAFWAKLNNLHFDFIILFYKQLTSNMHTHLSRVIFWSGHFEKTFVEWEIVSNWILKWSRKNISAYMVRLGIPSHRLSSDFMKNDFIQLLRRKYMFTNNLPSEYYTKNYCIHFLEILLFLALKYAKIN